MAPTPRSSIFRKGYLIDPAWSPKCQMVLQLARLRQFRIYIMNHSREIRQITRDRVRMSDPVGHLTAAYRLESTRNGQRQIWTMLAAARKPITHMTATKSAQLVPK